MRASIAGAPLDLRSGSVALRLKASPLARRLRLAVTPYSSARETRKIIGPIERLLAGSLAAARSSAGPRGGVARWLSRSSRRGPTRQARASLSPQECAAAPITASRAIAGRDHFSGAQGERCRATALSGRDSTMDAWRWRSLRGGCQTRYRSAGPGRGRAYDLAVETSARAIANPSCPTRSARQPQPTALGG